MQDLPLRHKSQDRFVIRHEDVEKPLVREGFFEIRPELAPQSPPATASSAPTAASKTLPELLINAETLIQHGELDLARVLIYKALSLDPHSSLALKKAKTFLHPQKDIAQRVLIQQQICKSEFCFETVCELAHDLYQQGNDEQALEKYHEALNLVTEESAELFEVHKNIGNILTRAGDFEGAEEFFHKAYTLRPESDILSVNLGTLAIQKNDFNAALERFRSAVKQNPKNDKAWMGLALVHQQMGDLALAFANVESALDINPDNRTAVLLYANWCARENKFSHAIEVVENYLSRESNDDEMSLVLVHLYCQINRWDWAQVEVSKALAWNPQNPQLIAVDQELKTMKAEI